MDVINATAKRIRVIVLASAYFRRFFGPINVNIVLRVVFSNNAIRLMATKRQDIKINTYLASMLTMLINVRCIVSAAKGMIRACMPVMICFRQLIFLATFNDSSSRAINYAQAMGNDDQYVLRGLSNFGVI